MAEPFGNAMARFPDFLNGDVFFHNGTLSYNYSISKGVVRIGTDNPNSELTKRM
jgi:hypothetical protein